MSDRKPDGQAPRTARERAALMTELITSSGDAS